MTAEDGDSGFPGLGSRLAPASFSRSVISSLASPVLAYLATVVSLNNPLELCGLSLSPLGPWVVEVPEYRVWFPACALVLDLIAHSRACWLFSACSVLRRFPCGPLWCLFL